MGNFSNLKNVDLPYKPHSLQFKKFIEDSSASTTPYYQIQGQEKYDNDDLTILDDFEFQGIDFDNIRPDEFQVDLDDDEEDSSDKSELNFQEYSVSYLERDSTIKIVTFKRDIIDEDEINQQAQSSPKLKTNDLDSMIYNLSLDELDFQMRGDGDESLDTKQQSTPQDTSFDLDMLLNSVDNAPVSFDEEDFQEFDFGDVEDNLPIRSMNDMDTNDTEENEDDEADSMDIDVVLPDSSSSITSNEEENYGIERDITGYQSALPALTSKASKIPVRYFPPQQQSLQRVPIHQDPIKQVPSIRQRPTSLYQQTLKKSARLQPQEYHRIMKSPKRICSPKRAIRPLKSVIKFRKDLLNLIVDAASGDQKEAARYGTEINSQNCEGVPLPESTKELVTIPTNNARETNKAAIIKAISPVVTETNKLQEITGMLNNSGPNGIVGTKRVGFYTEKDFQTYLSSRKKVVDAMGKENEPGIPAKRAKMDTDNNSDNNNVFGIVDKHKQVKWAENLEW